MDVLFLDANVLFSAAYRPRSGLLRFWRLASAGQARLATSSLAVAEAQRNLDSDEQRARLEKLLRNVRIEGSTADHPLPAVELPEKDRPILQAALGSKATHLITGNFKHFGPHFGRRIGGMIILPPAEYLRRRHGRKDA